MHTNFYRLAKICLWLLTAISAVGCIILPIIGADGIFREFGWPYSAEVHFQLLGEQIIGPAYTLLLSSALITVVLLRKHLVWWFWLTVLVGPLYTAQAVGGLSHDFSHTVFKECSGIYGSWITVLSTLAIVSLILLAGLSRFCERRIQYPNPQAESGPRE